MQLQIEAEVVVEVEDVVHLDEVVMVIEDIREITHVVEVRHDEEVQVTATRVAAGVGVGALHEEVAAVVVVAGEVHRMTA